MEGLVVSEEGKFDEGLVESFWSKVDVRGEGDCWEWKAGRGKEGYGVVWLKDRYYNAHRLAYVLAKGEIPHGLLACHDCDNPACCNPSHLWLGTNQDNMNDCKAKGRMPKGSARPNSKLTEAQVRTIRERAAEGVRGVMSALAREFGVSRSLITEICQGTAWTWLDGYGSPWTTTEAHTAA